MPITPIHIGIDRLVIFDGIAIDGDGHGALVAQERGDVAIEGVVMDRIVTPEDDDGRQLVFAGECHRLSPDGVQLGVELLLAFARRLEGALEDPVTDAEGFGELAA